MFEGEPNSPKATVLVIDDESAIRNCVTEAFSHAGFCVLEASDGVEGLEKFVKHRPTIVVTDIVMPGKEGMEIILEMKKLLPDVPIIAISGGGRLAPDDYLDMACKLGADSAMSKPFSLEARVRTARNLVPSS